MKTIKKKLKEFYLWNIKGKRTSKSFQRKIKNNIRAFFEGYGCGDTPEIDINISRFGITDFRFREFKKQIFIQITLERPGILIGRKGNVIDSLAERLSDRLEKKIKILIKESELWR